MTLRGEHRLPPGRGDKGLRREIVDFVGPRLLDDAHEARKIAEIAVQQGHAIGDAQPTQPVIFDAAMRRAANDPEDLVALVDQQLRQIGPILPGNPGDERSLHSDAPRDDGGDGVGKTTDRRRHEPAALRSQVAQRGESERPFRCREYGDAIAKSAKYEALSGPTGLQRKRI